MTKLLIVDDSEIVHSIVGNIVSSLDDITVVGNAYDGEEGIRLHMETQPDVVLMDVEMPNKNGLDATSEIMGLLPKPVIIFSSAGKRVANLAIKALEQGAVEIIEKPDSNDLESLADFIKNKLVARIRLFSDFQVVRRINTGLITRLAESSKRLSQRTRHESVVQEYEPAREEKYSGNVVAIAASTGGPQTVRHLLEYSDLPFSFPLVLLQHIPPGFFESYKDWMASCVTSPVKFAEEGEYPKPGIIYVANEGKHLGFDAMGRFAYAVSEPVYGIRPCADALFTSMAQCFMKEAVVVVLTGMGHDGQLGAVSVKKYGGQVIAQSKEGCILYGMPKAVIEAGLTDQVMNLKGIARYLSEKLK